MPIRDCCAMFVGVYSNYSGISGTFFFSSDIHILSEKNKKQRALREFVWVNQKHVPLGSRSFRCRPGGGAALLYVDFRKIKSKKNNKIKHLKTSRVQKKKDMYKKTQWMKRCSTTDWGGQWCRSEACRLSWMSKKQVCSCCCWSCN